MASLLLFAWGIGTANGLDFFGDAEKIMRVGCDQFLWGKGNYLEAIGWYTKKQVEALYS